MGMAMTGTIMDDHYQGFHIGREPNTLTDASTAVRVTDLTDGPINPNPTRLDPDDELLEEFLSPRKLRALTGVEDLDEVTFLDMQIDSEECSLGNFGMHLPNLRHLKLSNSIIANIRDLGTALGSLEVLWMPRSCLECLDGLVTMSNLRELYLAFNEVTDVSPCGMLESLEILDLEGNLIDDMMTLAYLAMCPRLQRLTLEGNPICKNFQPTPSDPAQTFRDVVMQTLPQLQYLDDVPVSESAPVDPHSTATLEFDEHWSYINTVLKESGLLAESSRYRQQQEEAALAAAAEEEESKREGRIEGATAAAAMPPRTAQRRSPGTPNFRPATSGLRPSSANRRMTAPRRAIASPGNSSLGSGGPRPMSGSSRPSTGRPLSSTSNGSRDESMDLTDESTLTAGAVVCGNISKALRARRTSPTRPPTGAAASPALRPRPATALPGGCRPTAQAQVFTPRPVMTQPGERQMEAAKAAAEAEEGDEAFSTLMTELQQWRQQYEETRLRIEKERAPQILRIDHDEAAAVVDDEGEEELLSEEEPHESQESFSASASASDSTSARRLPSPPSSPPSASGLKPRRVRPQEPVALEAAKKPVIPAIAVKQRPKTAAAALGASATLLPSKPQPPINGGHAVTRSQRLG